VWARLRAEAPVAPFAPPGRPPFWAITKHADIVATAGPDVRPWRPGNRRRSR
jgi:hypothetical protein